MYQILTQQSMREQAESGKTTAYEKPGVRLVGTSMLPADVGSHQNTWYRVE